MARRKALHLQQQVEAELDQLAPPPQSDTLNYIAEMAAELASLAGAERMSMLTYFLNMARVEAEMAIAERAERKPAIRARA